VTLITDFGTRDGFVGAMKGVILSINPDVRLVDITHDIDPQDLVGAAFALNSSYPFFPEGTVHLVVVDPGVGGQRRPIALEGDGHLFVGPDNGIFSMLRLGGRISRAVEIRERRFMLPEISCTFHGRDIFAPAAAYLSKGTDIGLLGPELAEISTVRMPRPSPEGDTLAAEIIHIDRFGNLVTNLTPGDLSGFAGDRPFVIEAGAIAIGEISPAYEDVPEGRPLAIWDSFGFLEIAVNRGNASEMLGLGRGSAVRVRKLG